MFNRSKPLKRFAVSFLNVNVHNFKLGSDVLYCAGKPYHRITGFITAAAKPHGAHGSHGDACASDSRDDLDHDVSLALALAA